MPVRWQVIGGLFFVIVVIASLFLSLAGYSRIETVGGLIAPEGGIAQIVPTRAGIIANLSVEAGQRVGSRAALAIITTEESLAGGAASSAQILESLNAQEQGLRRQEEQISAAANAERARLEARILGFEAEVSGLRNRIRVQDGLVKSARDELEAARGIAERGFISRRDILQREEVWLGREQQLSLLRQTLAMQQAAIGEASAAMRQTSASSGAQIAALAGQRSDIAQRRTGAAASRAYRLEAPVAGTVTALTARVGQAVSPQAPIMAILPDGSELRAELYVPSNAIGFLEVGQEVALALDAFPYQRFGTTPARVTAIAAAPVVQAGADGNAIPAYLVIAALERNRVSAYGDQRELIAGMTLTARITTERQSLFEWLFEPLFAVRRR
ncbi:MAG: HlyD family efflux transporter periplasmic adaptor subunit [Sphingomonadales bacterium]|nr:HlyD family efflux transporter periplasmic adaptor subunit [Sphingomonadales bacterium]NCQ22200.1 HlyD family efflux transporter periplasmic adaptor subunit [Sphingomonadales bacterium]NCT03558.1 HlyD family efflux transporter periplasmic adaptor subunit [Sphingomonadales bacterium]